MHTPTPPSIRNAERMTLPEQCAHSRYAMAQVAVLREQAHPKYPPSQQMQVHQDYEYARFGVLGLRAPASGRGYYLIEHCTSPIASALERLAETPKPSRGRRKPARNDAAWLALSDIAKAYGYRYIPALEMIEDQLTRGKHLVQFRLERKEFRQFLEHSADAAHQINDKGQNPQAVREVIELFASELLALCPWLEAVGYQAAAQRLRERVAVVMG